MNKQKLQNYAESLFARIDECVILKKAHIDGGDWQPQAKRCHDNVSFWCDYNNDFTPVRGWLYFDLPDLNYVKFVAHSVVLTPEKELYDITPSDVLQEYPFIIGNLSDQDYSDLIETLENGEINYEVNKA